METHAQNIATKTGFDVMTIFAILEAIMSALKPIIENCGQPVPPAKEAMAKADGPTGRLAIIRGLRENGIRVLSQNGRALHRAIVDEAQLVDDDTASQIMALAM